MDCSDRRAHRFIEALTRTAVILVIIGWQALAPVQGATLEVCPECEYALIQEAVDAAGEGDVVVVEGVFNESVEVSKGLTLRGMPDGPRPLVDGRGGDGIVLLARDSVLEDFTVANSSSGVAVRADGCAVRGVNVSSSETGILVQNASNCTVEGNVASGNGVGISLVGTNASSVEYNVLTKNRVGIYLEGSSRNNLTANIVVDGLQRGVYLWGSYENMITRNNVSSNPEGIYLEASYDNVLGRNRILDVIGHSAYDDGSNQWDCGAVGNLYADFDGAELGCTDGDGDGLCDSVYRVYGNSSVPSVDRYPLAVWRTPVRGQLVALVTPRESYCMMGERAIDPGFVVLDIRTPGEYAAGRLEGSVNLDFYSESFGEGLDALDRGVAYLVYCRSGNRSGKALAMMEEMGFAEVYGMLGGTLEWAGLGYPLVAESGPPPA